MSYTIGNFNLTGLQSEDITNGDSVDNDYTGQYYGLDNPQPDGGGYNAPGYGDNFIFNWAGNSATTSQPEFGYLFVQTPGGSVAGVSGSATDSWTISVSVDELTGGDVPGGGSSGLASVEYDGSAVTTISGSGAADLQAAMQNLQVVDSDAFNDPFAVQFSIDDTTTDPTSATPTVFTEYFETACYLAGTRIATPRGEATVEELREGDLVMTRSGVAKPVKWVGRRAYTAAQLAAHAQLRPVLVRKDALAAGMPHRDLQLSGMHALFIDDVFVPAASLVNGVSVVRSDELTPVTYFHIELADHDVVFAEGTPAETFVDDSSRLLFDNADEYYDRFGAAVSASAFCAARVEEGFQLEAVRRRLAARAGLTVTATAPGALRGHVERFADGTLQGWVMDSANPSVPVELDVLVDGESVARVLANRYRTDLDHAGLAGGRCAFAVAMPASVTSLAQIAVRRAADGRALAMPKVAASV